jgi:hypothetical protein
MGWLKVSGVAPDALVWELRLPAGGWVAMGEAAGAATSRASGRIAAA